MSETEDEAWARMTPHERLREAASWNLVATTREIAAAKARKASHPATILSEAAKRGDSKPT
jgi:hypothetical protein